MKRKLQLLGVVAMTTLMGLQMVSAQTALPGVIEAETGTLYGGVVQNSGNGGTLNVISGLYGTTARYAEYPVTVATAGFFDVSVVYLNTSVATNSTAGLRISIPALAVPYNVFGGYFLPAAGIFSAYATATKAGFYMPAGTYTLKVENPSGIGINIDNLTFTSAAGRAKFGTAVNVTSANTATNIIEAENYDLGGEGITFHDTTLGNATAALLTTVSYRADNIDIAASVGVVSNDYLVSNVIGGEWMEYSVNVADAGAYKFEITYASGNPATNVTNGKLTAATYDTSGTLLTELIPTATPIYVAGNSNWQDYRMIESDVFNLGAGANQIIRISLGGGSINLDKFRLVYTGPSLGVNSFSANSKALNAYPNPSANGVFNLGEASKWEAYSVLGSKVAEGEGTVVNLSASSKGVYLIKTVKGTTKVVFQ